MSKQELTTEQAELYNSLLDLNWSKPRIQLTDIIEHTKERHININETLSALATKGKVLTGPEDFGDGIYRHTFTPLIKGGNAYGYPMDFFKDYATWMLNAAKVA